MNKTSKVCAILHEGFFQKNDPKTTNEDESCIRIRPAPCWPNPRNFLLKPGPGKRQKKKKLIKYKKTLSPNDICGKRCKVSDQARKVISYWAQRPAGQTSRLSRWSWGRGEGQASKKASTLSEMCGNSWLRRTPDFVHRTPCVRRWRVEKWFRCTCVERGSVLASIQHSRSRNPLWLKSGSAAVQLYIPKKFVQLSRPALERCFLPAPTVGTRVVNQIIFTTVLIGSRGCAAQPGCPLPSPASQTCPA
jgi:hypothetical protein